MKRPRSSSRWAGVLIAGLLLFLFIGLIADPRPILIESLESRTLQDGAVFNRIQWFPGWKQDVWMMQQSHHGLDAQFENWDRLAIVVDKTRSPKVARFYQIEPGQLSWTPHARPVPYVAACFMCHSNGPRAIRPRLDSDQMQLSAWNRLRVTAADFRIKTYGHILGEAGQSVGLTPFRYSGAVENEKLPIQTCMKCHREAWWGRGALTRQNSPTIDFMVRNGIMPPPGFKLSAPEKRELCRFLKGF
jgi:hypothetical protein